ncbi:hypothetical protein HLB23_00965 [Nocardia uniformis]|uniref:Uncharacterized protein n=1 Tax=Nocardia uniformis TaxID=53432 RepID=A0A849BXQ6_9NOCA|nr:hypothetical protein [Nocardia uniformis]NNH68467.1 hypothetical protein [Nocardia uniformis]
MNPGHAALVLAGALTGPVAGGQLILLSKPFGGVVGIPGTAAVYIALTGLVVGCATGLLTLRHPLSARAAGCCAVVAGGAFAVAGLVSTLWLFVAVIVLACAAAGPLIVAARVFAFRQRALLTGGHIVTAVCVAGAAGAASLWFETPGAALVVVGLAAALLGGVAILAKAPVPHEESNDGSGAVPRRFLVGYATVGLLLGGTVLPALHLLLFRWNAFGAEQTDLLLLAALPAVLVVAIPGPDASAVAPLLILAAGGPVLVATAPGQATVVIGLAVTLAAAARAARGLDLALRARDAGTEHHDAGGRPAVGAGGAQSDRAAAITALTVTLGGLGGLGLVVALGELFGTGTGLTALAIPALAAALLSGPRIPTPSAGSAVATPAFEGGTP